LPPYYPDKGIWFNAEDVTIKDKYVEEEDIEELK
jgi:hypothetical protein